MNASRSGRGRGGQGSPRALNIREAVNRRRQALGWSYEKLAGRAGVHRSTVARWLGPAAAGLKLDTAERVLRAMGFTGLVGGRGKSPPSRV